ncbi:hypothetical protein BDV24DRAFT_94430 [Aspergillus arachidicola]|uniref:TFIIS N-terminal domain-containing protein n=1 Tax=Aspergillus arachidicola TaxID=656916 RepID=A0A5N6XXH6_9EURO|nr:hypothetical protein BDV24DRAFT_94430 [Aspergillus arachidicola]
MSASPEIKPVEEDPVQAPTPGAGDDEAQGVEETTAADLDAADEKDNGSDDESILSEVDEAQFEDFDPENVDVEDRPQLAIDEDNLKLIGRHKERKRREPTPEDDETLDPATRRRRALDRAMDEALKKPTKRRFRKADGIDLEQMADAEIEDMRKRMTHAAQMDAVSRREGKPAMHKLKMLPEVVSLLNRNQYVNSLVDPEINLLEAVKFFLEPLDDGSLPAYNIQRDLMTSLAKLPINKEALVASGIGKVIVFYTRSKRPEAGIKRMAERLLAEWTRPILQRSDDYSKRVYQEAEFDPRYVTQSPKFG